MATLIIPTPLRKFTNNEVSFEANEPTVKSSIDKLIAKYPDIKQHLLDKEGNLRPFIKIFVGNQDINALEKDNTPVQSDTVISLVPAIAGGLPDDNIKLSVNGTVLFSKEEIERYSRHLIIPEFNINGQRKLKAAKVLVVGTGGLGSPLLLYLTAAGVGNIGIVDFDVVDETNLQRQVLFNVEDVGKSKVEVAKKKLLKLNPHVNIKTYNTRLTSENALGIVKDYELVADGTDNFPTRYLVNDACVFLNKPNIYASIFKFEGQVSVFNYTDKHGKKGPNYRDLFSTPPPPGLVPSCAEGGVIGVLPGIIGSLQANEVIKVITGIGDTLSGRLFLFDALSFETRILNISKDENNPISGKNPTINELVDYELFCGVSVDADNNRAKDVKEISVQDLKQWLDNKKDFQLIDVREPYEYDIVNIDGELLPLKNVAENNDKIVSDKPVVVHCRSGVRSAKAITELETKYGFKNLYNLKGGILAWANEIDESLPTY